MLSKLQDNVKSELPSLETLFEYEDYAREKSTANAWNYFSLYAAYDGTTRNNHDYMQKIRLRPRRMIPVDQFSTSLSVLGANVSMPIGFCPVSAQMLINPEQGEVAVSKAAQTAGTIQILSQWASKSIEEVAAAAPDAVKWQQVNVVAISMLSK